MRIERYRLLYLYVAVGYDMQIMASSFRLSRSNAVILVSQYGQSRAYNVLQKDDNFVIRTSQAHAMYFSLISNPL
jgi:hypothetical protein